MVNLSSISKKANAEQTTRKAMAYAVVHNKGKLTSLLRKHGAAVSPLASNEVVISAMLTKLPTSPAFRSDLTDLLSRMSISDSRFSFSADGEVAFGDIISATSSPAAAAASSSSASTSSGSGGGSVFSSLLSSDNISKLFSTGLNILSTKVSADANSSTAQKALQLEQEKTKQLQLAASMAGKSGTGTTTGGMSTGAKIAIGVGGAGLLILIIVLITKKRK